MKKIIFILFLLFFSFSGEVLASPDLIGASSAKSVVETRVEGTQVEVYQSVETTVNGETLKKESNQPGKLELEMKKDEASVKSEAESIVSTSTDFEDFLGLIRIWISRFFGIFTKAS